MKRCLMVALLLMSGVALAQAPRVRGIVESADDSTLRIKGPGGSSTEVRLEEKTQLLFMQPIAFEDIKSGDFLAITSLKRPDGTLAAAEIRRFPKPVSPGHRPFEGRDDQTMTNATVSATVEASAGRELTMTYEGGAQKIVVPPSAFISMLVPGTRAQLVPGTIVSIAATPGADGKPTATQVQFRAP